MLKYDTIRTKSIKSKKKKKLCKDHGVYFRDWYYDYL